MNKIKRIYRLAIILLISFLVIKLSATGESDNTKVIRSSEITVGGLELSNIVEHIANNISTSIPTSIGKDNYAAAKEPPLVIWLVDNTSSFKKSKCPEALSTAINKSFGKYPALKTALVRFAREPKIACNVTSSLQDIVKGIDAIFDAPDDRSKDPFEAIRFCVDTFKTYPFKKYLVLFTTQNNEMESDLEDTLSLLNENKFSLMVISGGSILSDPNDEAYGEKPPDSKVRRTDSAEIELEFKNPHLDWWYPKGIPEKGVTSGDQYYLHKYPYYNTAVYSGYGVYGLSRLAAYSGGRYYIYYPPTNTKSSSFCELHYCIWCDSNNKKGHSGGSGCNTSYNKFLPGMAPVLISRQGYSTKYACDPMFQLLMQITSKSGGAWVPSGLKTIFDENGKLAEGYLEQIGKQFKNMDELIKTSEDTLSQKGKEGDLRFEAHCAVTLANLYIERFDLNQFKYFIERLEIKNLDKPQEWQFSYIKPVFECLCHFDELLTVAYQPKKDEQYAHGTDLKTKIDQAVKIFIQKSKMEFYGGKAGEEELKRTLEAVAKTITRYKGTPWELVARRLPIIIKLKIEYGHPGTTRTQEKPPEPIKPTQPTQPGQTPSGPRPTETGK